MKKNSLSLLFLLVCFIQLKAQDLVQTAVIEFEKTTHDFEKINEGGSVSYEFKFTNKGKVPLVISNVRASCGCTTPGWTKEAVLPGKTGVITAQYNTVNRPGVFNKNLTVMANTEPMMTMLYIKGNVIPKVKTPEELYPKKIGKIRLFSEHIYLGRVTTKEPFVKEVTLYNEGPDPVTVSVADLPKHIEVFIPSPTVAAKEKLVLKITYNALKRNELGPVDDQVVLVTNEATDNKKILNITADINEYYPPLSAEDAANAPKLILSKSSYDFDKIKPNQTYTAEIEISNTGKQDLTIKKVRSGAPYVNVKADKMNVKAGETSKLKITYKADGKKMGLDNQFIWIYSNDPMTPTQNITIKANVVQ
jgi:hypothetical protein